MNASNEYEQLNVYFTIADSFIFILDSVLKDREQCNA